MRGSKYSDETREATVSALMRGDSCDDVAERMGIPVRTVRHWCQQEAVKEKRWEYLRGRVEQMMEDAVCREIEYRMRRREKSKALRQQTREKVMARGITGRQMRRESSESLMGIGMADLENFKFMAKARLWAEGRGENPLLRVHSRRGYRTVFNLGKYAEEPVRANVRRV